MSVKLDCFNFAASVLTSLTYLPLMVHFVYCRTQAPYKIDAYISKLNYGMREPRNIGSLFLWNLHRLAFKFGLSLEFLSLAMEGFEHPGGCSWRAMQVFTVLPHCAEVALPDSIRVVEDRLIASMTYLHMIDVERQKAASTKSGQNTILGKGLLKDIVKK